MGFRFRKSIRVGKYFRVNVSKSGIGYSIGKRGARITVSANGRKTGTIGIPGTGISYSKTLGGKEKSDSSVSSYIPPVPQDTEIAVKGAAIENFQPTDCTDIFREIKKCRIINLVSIILFIYGLACVGSFRDGFIARGILFLIIMLIGVAGFVLARTKLPVQLDYDIAPDMLAEHERRLAAWKQMCSSCRKWQIIGYADVSKIKTNAGANLDISRKPFSATEKMPYYIKINNPCFMLNLKGEKLIILPDKMLIVKGFKVGAIDYSDVHYETDTLNFVETEGVSGDTEVIRQTWQYVNKDGTPDKRYANNKQLPICAYGELKINSATGLNVWLQFSDRNKISLFEEI